MHDSGDHLTPEIVQTIAGHAEAEAPSEACGLLFAGGRYYRARNIQDELNLTDPECYPRSSERAYAFSFLDASLVSFPDVSGMPLAIVHSHTLGAGSYLSSEDRVFALRSGYAALGIDQIVVGVAVDRCATEVATYCYEGDIGFVERGRWLRKPGGTLDIQVRTKYWW